jgi:sugar phosphate isomerase/epimerase
MFPFKTALNTSTLFPFDLDVKQQVAVAAEAGFEGIELWVKDIQTHLQRGGTIADLRAYIADTGISIVNAIAFFPWADADAATRERGFAQAREEMLMLAELGCPAVAAPPYGDVAQTSLAAMATYFSQLTELARTIGVVPYLEFWGRARRLSRLSEALYVAMESRLSDVKILLDPFHMYTGGSDVNGVAYLRGANVGIVHANDYPADPPRESIADADRVFPGDGIAPSRVFAQLLDQAGYRGYISLELFISDYGGASAVDVARRGAASVRSAYAVGS